MDNLPHLFDTLLPSLALLRRVSLLKAIESAAATVFLTSEHILSVPEGKQRAQAINASLHSNFEGVQDFSEHFYSLLALAAKRQLLTRDLIKLALDKLPDHGFGDFDRILIAHSCDIATTYDQFYAAWAKAVQGNEVAKKLQEHPPPASSELLQNQYTIIQLNAEGEYYDVPYAVFFKKELGPVLAAFDAAVAELETVKHKTPEQLLYVKYLVRYRKCLAEEDPQNLEPLWEELDRIWMDIRYPLQIVHDIESGYGDPLRIKIIPDFSLRFVDDEYKEANEKIARIQKVMVDWFATRPSELARKGLSALASSFAAIYYIPFQSGMSLHFRFSGQSIPNRSTVKDEKGVKIYFDPISTRNRQSQTEKLVCKVFDEPLSSKLLTRMNPVETITYHVAAHEVGHAIYNLEHVKQIIKSVATKSLLEEPRAELTSLHTMKLLVDNNIITETEAQKYLSTFALQDLRRFAMFSASATRPYTISAINTYKTYEQVGYITRKNNGSGESLTIDDSKALEVLKIFSQQFEKILAAEDNLDGDGIEEIRRDMEQETPFIAWLVNKLRSG